MPDYLLSLLISGRGDDPNHRSHWALAIHLPSSNSNSNSNICTLHQVNLISEAGLIYQFETRRGQLLDGPGVEGYFQLARFDADEHGRVTRLIAGEPAPRNGRDRCQDWVLGCVVVLETEELVGDGMAELVNRLVGKNVEEVKEILKDRWCGNG